MAEARRYCAYDYSHRNYYCDNGSWYSSINPQLESDYYSQETFERDGNAFQKFQDYFQRPGPGLSTVDQKQDLNCTHGSYEPFSRNPSSPSCYSSISSGDATESSEFTDTVSIPAGIHLSSSSIGWEIESSQSVDVDGLQLLRGQESEDGGGKLSSESGGIQHIPPEVKPA